MRFITNKYDIADRSDLHSAMSAAEVIAQISAGNGGWGNSITMDAGRKMTGKDLLILIEAGRLIRTMLDRNIDPYEVIGRLDGDDREG